MAQNYQKIGDYISVLDNRNADGSIKNLMGISIEKCFIPSVANVIGTDLHNYKVIKKGQFACSLMQVSRDQRIPLAMYTSDEPAIMSPAYVMFEVNRTDELLPEYMELWFKRTEFDREASFYAVGGVRGSLDWEDFCKMKFPVPPISEQSKIIHNYQVIIDRIELLRKMNKCLTNTAKQVFISKFINDNKHDSVQLRELCEVTSGKRVPKELDFSDVKTNHPYIRVRDIHDGDYVCLTDAFEYIDDQTYEYISKYTVIEDDIIVSSVGTVGLISRIHHTLQDANLTENCFRVRCYNKKYADYIFYALSCYKDLRLLENIIDGSVQAKLPLEKFRSFPICSPTDDELGQFISIIRPIKQILDRNNSELLILAKVLDFTKSNISKGA